MMEEYNLFDISTPKQWKTISSKYLLEDGEYPVYGANGIIGRFDKYNHEEETVLITCRGATCGSVNLSQPYSYINGNAMAIDNVDKSKINNKYLFYFFKQYNFNNVITGTAQPQITRTSLKNVTIPIPDLPTQNKIVALLDKASALVQKREKSIAQLDELLRAQFLEMFGDPVLNPMGWKMMPISKVIKEMKGGWSIGGEYRSLKENELGVLKISAVTSGYFRENEFKAVSKDKINRELVIPKKGDLLFSRANTKEMVGSTCLVPKDYDYLFLPDKLWKLIPNKDLISTFFLKPVLSNKGFRLEISKLATGTGGSMKNISKAKLRKMEIPVPPIELQNKFETIYHNIQAQKDTLTQSKKELENLYNSLLQRAFSGQLNFNVDIELDALLAAINLEQDTEKEKYDIKEIATVYAGRLLERIEEQNFENQTQYQQAKQVVFQMLKEGSLVQEYDDKTAAIKLKLV